MRRDEFTIRRHVDVVRFYDDCMELQPEGGLPDPVWIVEATVEGHGWKPVKGTRFVFASEVKAAFLVGVDALALAEAECAAAVVRATGPSRSL